MVLLLSNEPPSPLGVEDNKSLSVSVHSSPSYRFLHIPSEAEYRGPILNLTISAQSLEKTVEWCAVNCGNHADHVKVNLLNNFRTLLSHSKQLILVHDSIAKSLLNLINDCRAYRSSTVEAVLLKLLYDLCTLFYNQPQVFQCFSKLALNLPTPDFLPLRILVNHMYRDDPLGEFARKAIYLLICATSLDQKMMKYISEKSNFCSILATGISGTYSSLPSTLPHNYLAMPVLTSDDCDNVPYLFNFLQAVQFCNSLCNISHKIIRENIRDFILAGFLCPIVLPAISQVAVLESLAATAYLDLFIRTISEPSLMKCTLHFILTTKVDNQALINLIIRRVNTPVIPSSPGSIDENLESNFIEALSTASLCFLSTLIDLKSEDVMLELFLSFLLPCDHLLITQKSVSMETDNYGRSAEKFLSLVPGASRRARHRPLVVDKKTGKLPVENTSQNAGGGSLRLAGTGSYLTKQLHNKAASKLQRNFSAPQRRNLEATSCTVDNNGISEIVDQEATTEVITLAQFETSFVEYLSDAKNKITICNTGVKEWSSYYDGPKVKQSNLKLKKNKILDSKSSIFSTKSSEANYTAVNVSSSDSLLGSGLYLNGKDKELYSLESSLEKLEIENGRKENNHTDVDEINLEDYGKYLIEEEKVCDEIDKFLNDPFIKSIGCADNIENGDGNSNANTLSQELELLLNSSRFEKTTFRTKFLGPTEKKVLTRPSKLSLEKLECFRNGYIDTPTIMDLFPSPDTPLPERSMPSSRSIQSLHELSLKLDPKPGNAESSRLSQSMGTTEVRTLLRSSFSYSGIIFMGPCFNALFIKLEDLCDNSFNTNLVLTGIFASLCSYPLPLLRSFLLNPNLIFQNAVKTLYSVLRKVQSKIETSTEAIDNFQELLLRGRYYFANIDRFGHLSIEEFLTDSSVYGSCKNLSAGSGLSQLLNSGNQHSFNSADNSGESKKSKISTNVLGALFRRKNAPRNKQSEEGVKNGNTIVHYRSAESLMEAKKIRDAVLSVIIMEEFAKELAALAQEHSVFDQSNRC